MGFSDEETYFTVFDYGSFIFMFVFCIAIGVYFGYFHVSKNINDYLVGGRSMSVIPVAISLVVSDISAISLLGLPTEVYLYGMQYLYLISSLIIMSLIGLYLILPVFMELQLTSVYEYMELRFDRSIRLFGSILFITGIVLWVPIVLYVPALAFNHVTGIEIYLIIPIVCSICIFYTCMGGIKAVIWTDFIQAFIMIGSVLFVGIKATIDVGGLGVVIERNLNTSRIELPDLNPSPYKRYTFWGSFIGMGITFVDYEIINQMMMQRYMTLPSFKAVKHTLYYFCIIKIFVTVTIGYCGLLIFAHYFNCDPISAKIIKVEDQLLPLLVIQTLKNIPGVTGLFISGVFSASLSSLSSALNSIAAIFLEDMYKPLFKDELSQRHCSLVLKVTVIVVGIIVSILALFVDKLGTVLQLSVSLAGIATGPVLGLYTMGILLPFINAKGAKYGGIIAMGVLILINYKAYSSGTYYSKKPLTTEGCDFNITITNESTYSENVTENEHISFVWYSLIGLITAVFSGSIISFLTGCNKNTYVDPKLFAPVIRKYLTTKNNNQSANVNRQPEEIALKLATTNFDED